MLTAAACLDPQVAVVPLLDMEGKPYPTLAHLADGITEELIFELGRFKKLFVASRSATRAIAFDETGPQSVGDRLGVRYVLSGTIRKMGSQVRMNLSLSESETGSVGRSAIQVKGTGFLPSR